MKRIFAAAIFALLTFAAPAHAAPVYLYDLSLNFGDGYTNPGVGEFSCGVAATPLPAALPLFGTALVGLGGVGWFRRRGKVSAINRA
jgi:hypothetical protein